MTRNIAVLALLCALTFGIYGGTLDYPFVYDDTHVITGNLRLRDPSYIPKFYYTPGMYSFGEADQVSYRPFLFTTYALNYMASGLDPAPYRLANIALHILCGMLVYLLALSFMEASPPGGGEAAAWPYAIGAALLFAAHPVQTEAVVYTSARSASLVTAACLVSLWFFIRYLSNRKTAWLAASAAGYAAAVLTKETAVPFLLVFPLAGRALERGAPDGKRVPRRAYAPHIAVAAAYLAFRAYFFARYGFQGLETGGYAQHLAGSVAALPGYLKLILAPFGLCIDHYAGPPPGVADPRFLMGVLLVGAALAASYYLYRGKPTASALLAWPLIAMSPEIAVPVEDVLVEYRLYLPMAGISILTAYAAMRLSSGTAGLKAGAGLALCVAAFAAMLALSHNRALVWQSPASLWSDAVRKYPGNPRAHSNLGESIAAEDPAGAMKQFEEAVRLKPDYDDALNNLGAALADTGRPDEAVGYFRAALSVDKRHYNANFNLVATLIRLGRYEDARRACAAMASEFPDSPDTPFLSERIPAEAVTRPGEASARNANEKNE